METTDTLTPLISLAAQGAGTVNSPIQCNPWGRGVTVGINTTVDAAGSYVVNLQGLDTASNTFYTLASSAAIVATGFASLTVYPGATVAANVAVSAPLPRSWRVQAVVTTGPITATVGASVML